MFNSTKTKYIILIEDALCSFNEVTSDQIHSQERLNRNVFDTRAMIWWMLYYKLGMTYREIGERYGRDHSTIITAVKKCEDSVLGRRADRIIRKLVPEIQRHLHNTKRED